VWRVVFAGRSVVVDLAVTVNAPVALLPLSPDALTAYLPMVDVAVVE
jgi:hypothetical protein